MAEAMEKITTGRQSQICVMEKSKRIDVPLPTFFGNQRDPHSKKFLAEIEKYFVFRKINEEGKMLVIENSLKGKAASWYAMMKYASPNFDKFKDLFLKQYFSESH